MGGSNVPRDATIDHTASTEQIHARLVRLYGREDAEAILPAVVERMERAEASLKRNVTNSPWSERDVVLIAYADQIQGADGSPLTQLRKFLTAHQLDDVFRTVHLLPFFPYSSDDGFSVVDYLEVDPRCGTWADVDDLGTRVELMFDLVLNHISQHSAWFQGYLRGEFPYDQFFIEVDPATDLSQVVRPRSLPLLTPCSTSRGPRHVWTTFSADQIDLDYSQPQVLLSMIDVLLDYVERGARIVRLDAVAFLWKKVGTTCLHLPETHEVVKLFRDILCRVAPDVLILTETNVPHEENVSYFGDGDEAHMVYQFSLPPLLAEAFVAGDASPISAWLADLSAPPAGATYFNFTASHDGIGLRPLEGLVTPARLQQLVQRSGQLGGRISTRQQADGSQVPYEMNITYVDVLSPRDGKPEHHIRRLLSSQATMLALRGMPACYLPTLLGLENDQAAVEASGQPRRINRQKVDRQQLARRLDDRASLSGQLFAAFVDLLKLRIRQPAFHPDAPQVHVASENPAVFAFRRASLDGSQHVLVAVNVSEATQEFRNIDPDIDWQQDLLSDRKVANGGPIVLEPGESAWLST